MGVSMLPDDRTRGVFEAMDAAAGHGRSDDGLIRATVDGAGRLATVTIEPEAMRLPSRELASRIVAAARNAHHDVSSQWQAALTRRGIGDLGAPVDHTTIREDAFAARRETERLNVELEAAHRSLRDRLNDL